MWRGKLSLVIFDVICIFFIDIYIGTSINNWSLIYVPLRIIAGISEKKLHTISILRNILYHIVILAWFIAMLCLYFCHFLSVVCFFWIHLGFSSKVVASIFTEYSFIDEMRTCCSTIVTINVMHTQKWRWIRFIK